MVAELDAAGLTPREVNARLRELAATDARIRVLNPHSMHNLAINLAADIDLTIEGSAGFYLGGFMRGPRVTVTGNVGWYTADNMLDGSIVIERNAGSNIAPSMIGGVVVVRGTAGSRVAYGLKGGSVVMCGDIGMLVGQQMLGGRVILLGNCGPKAGESMYRGFIHFRGEMAGLGGNVELVSTPPEEQEAMAGLFERFGLDADPAGFQTIIPRTGKHKYVLFEPVHAARRRAEVQP